MIPGVKPRLEIGADEDLTQDKEKEFPVAISQWKMVAGLLLEARGAVVAKPERMRPTVVGPSQRDRTGRPTGVGVLSNRLENRAVFEPLRHQG